MKRITVSILAFLLITASCGKAAKESTKIQFRKILILGNSITKHPKAPNIGWNGDWGMAASSPEKDYVHLLESGLRQSGTLPNITAVNISAFERNYPQYDFSELDSLKQLKPDLIILRIGENVEDSLALKNDFKTNYRGLIDYFKEQNPDVKIIVAGSFWKKNIVEEIIKQVAQQSGCLHLQLNYLSEDPSNMAFTKFTDPGVGAHPGDKGMYEISRLILAEIAKISEK